MDFYALAQLAGHAFVGICLLIAACAIDRHTDAIRDQDR